MDVKIPPSSRGAVAHYRPTSAADTLVGYTGGGPPDPLLANLRPAFDLTKPRPSGFPSLRRAKPISTGRACQASHKENTTRRGGFTSPGPPGFRRGRRR